MEPAPQVQAGGQPTGAGTAAQPHHPADGRGQPAAVPLHPGVAGAVRLLQLHRGDPPGARQPGRTPLVPLRPPVPAPLQRAQPRAAWAPGPRLQAHVQVHELLHVAADDRAGQERGLLLGLGAGGAHRADGVRRGRADGAAHPDGHYRAGRGHHHHQVGGGGGGAVRLQIRGCILCGGGVEASDLLPDAFFFFQTGSCKCSTVI